MNRVIDTLEKEIARLEEELRVHKEALMVLLNHLNPPDEDSFDESNLSIRCTTALRAAGINNKTQLEDFVIKGGNLIRLKNIGRRSCNEIYDYLHNHSNRQDELEAFYWSEKVRVVNETLG